jgi:hypothetical protein
MSLGPTAEPTVLPAVRTVPPPADLLLARTAEPPRGVQPSLAGSRPPECRTRRC